MNGLQMLMAAFGMLALLIGVAVALQRVRTLAGGRSAAGRVVGHHEETRSGTRGSLSRASAPIVEFEHGGRKVRFRSGFAQANPPPLGTVVTVRYLPADPEGSAAIAKAVPYWGLPLAMLAFGAAIIGFVLHPSGDPFH